MIYIHSFSKYGGRTVTPSIFDRLKEEGKIRTIIKNGEEQHFFKQKIRS